MVPSDLQLLESAPLRHLLSVPPAAEPTPEPRPVLCFLHGYDEAAPLDIRRALTRHGPLAPGSAPDAVRDFVVVAPQLPTPGDIWRRYAEEVFHIVATVQAQHGGDPERTYLTGFSFGGNGVFDLALARADLWAALWPVDPTRVPDRDPRLPVWLASGEVSRYRRSGFIERLELRTAGVDDPGDRVYHDRGLDHVGTATAAYRDPHVYRWLLSHRRPPPP